MCIDTLYTVQPELLGPTTEDCCSVASQVRGTILIKSHLFDITDGKQCRLVPKKIIARHSSVKMLSTIHYCIDIPATPTTVYILVTYHCARSKADYLAEYPSPTQIECQI